MYFKIIVFFIEIELFFYHLYNVLKSYHHSLMVVIKILKADHLLFFFLCILFHHFIDVLVWKFNPFENLRMLLSCLVEVFYCKILQVLIFRILFRFSIHFDYFIEIILCDDFCFLVVDCFHLK